MNTRRSIRASVTGKRIKEAIIYTHKFISTVSIQIFESIATAIKHLPIYGVPFA